MELLLLLLLMLLLLFLLANANCNVTNGLPTADAVEVVEAELLLANRTPNCQLKAVNSLRILVLTIEVNN